MYTMSNEYVIIAPVSGTSFKYLHMTICFLGHVDDKKLDIIKEDLQILSKQVLPLEITFGHADLFGPNYEIPVLLVDIVDKDKLKLLDEFYQKYHAPTEEGVEDTGHQNYHVNVKKVLGELSLLDSRSLNTLNLKQIGDHPAIIYDGL